MTNKHIDNLIQRWMELKLEIKKEFRKNEQWNTAKHWNALNIEQQLADYGINVEDLE